MAKINKAGANQAPAVIVKQDCRVYWQGHTVELKTGQIVDGPLAAFLAATGAPVEVSAHGASGGTE